MIQSWLLLIMATSISYSSMMARFAVRLWGLVDMHEVAFFAYHADGEIMQPHEASPSSALLSPVSLSADGLKEADHLDYAFLYI